MKKKIEALERKLEAIGYVTILILIVFYLAWAFVEDRRINENKAFRQNVGIAIEIYSKTLEK